LNGSAARTGVTGTINGTFYGPMAAETGGNFTLQSSLGLPYKGIGHFRRKALKRSWLELSHCPLRGVHRTAGIWHILAIRKAGREGQLPTQLRRFRTAMRAAASGAF